MWRRWHRWTSGCQTTPVDGGRGRTDFGLGFWWYASTTAHGSAGDDKLTDLQVRGKVSLKDGHTMPIYFDLAEPLAPSVLAERLQR